jgi:hypothetical protein
MIKFKADNIGCGDCRMKAVSNLVSQGAKKVSFDMATSQIHVDEGSLGVDKVIELIEKASIFVEGVISDTIRIHVAYQKADEAELNKLLASHEPIFSQPGIIEFAQGADVYDIEDLLSVYGYKVTKVEQN